MLRDYQHKIAVAALEILKQYNIVFLSMEVRTGKTLTALAVASGFKPNAVLFVTKKKAKSSIQSDYEKLNPGFDLYLTNYEQLQNIPSEGFDVIICDESHCLGQFPTPALRTRLLRQICCNKPIIYLSGTPSPESYSQLYHQFWISSFSPFYKWPTFYKWANDFVTIGKKYFFNRAINDYSKADKEKIDALTKHLFISYSQDQAGFTEYVKEEIIYIRMKEQTYSLANKLQANRIYIGQNGEEVLADTEVKMMQKLHQIYSGSVLTESGQAICFDNSKADFIKEHFAGKKIAIFYKFRAEQILLQEVFANTTTDPDEFNNSTDKTFISQIQSGREGINLSTADCIIIMNPDYSAVSYFQARARLQTRDRTKAALLYWIFSEGGIEEKIYKAISNKKNYTLSYFKKDYAIRKRSAITN